MVLVGEPLLLSIGCSHFKIKTTVLYYTILYYAVYIYYLSNIYLKYAVCYCRIRFNCNTLMNSELCSVKLLSGTQYAHGLPLGLYASKNVRTLILITVP
jgi:hypothetical protein